MKIGSIMWFISFDGTVSVYGNNIQQLIFFEKYYFYEVILQNLT